MLTSCVDYFDTNDFVVNKPGSSADYEYLNDYEPLKNYLDRSKHPDFKVSAALTASEFNDKGNLYTLSRANFDEVVAGNAMKMASVVSNKGEFDYATVTNFVTNAEAAGLTVYGHTLAWHAQQPVAWLNKLIADKPKPVDPNGSMSEVVDYELKCSDVTGLSWNGCPEGEVAINYNEDGALTMSNAALIDPWYAFQYWVVNGINLSMEKEYTITINCRYEGDAEAAINFKLGDWGDGTSTTFKLSSSSDFEDVVIKGTPKMESNGIFLQHADGFLGKIYWKSFKISHMEAVNNNVEYKDVYNKETVQLIARDATHADVEAEVVAGGGPNGEDAVVLIGKTETKNSWDTQFFIYTPDKKWEAGEKYRLHMWYKATANIGTDSQVHAAPGDYKHWQMLNPNPSFTTEWQEKTWEGTIPSEGAGTQQSIAFNLNKNRTADEGASETVAEIDYYFAGITWESVTKVEVPKVEIVHTDYVENSDMEGSDAANFVKKESEGELVNVITDGVGVNGSRGVQVVSKAGAAQDWDTQFWIKLTEPLEVGQTVTVEFDYKASAPVTVDTQAHGTPGDYAHWACVGSPSFTTEWQSYKNVLTVTGDQASKGGLGSIAFNLSKDKDNDITFFFDNIKVWAEEEHEIKSTIPLTEEEKRDTLTFAMKKWIDGMMDATEGKVKAWDLINEAISGGGDVNGFYDLQHANADAPNDFFWQDYFGSENYGVLVEKLAREAYARQENANPADLKLFINDYNLESTWDNNKKLESLIYWIGVWEKGGAKIDGIGSQMHISYFLDANDQENQKKAITNMLQKMSDTGKLVRISELDMGVAKTQADAFKGEMLSNDEMTFEIEKAMSDYYQWIIKEYFRIVPAAQQYGICQWCITDSPKGSGWRAEEPVGLWYLDYTRKPAYAGWAEGLKE